MTITVSSPKTATVMSVPAGQVIVVVLPLVLTGGGGGGGVGPADPETLSKYSYAKSCISYPLLVVISPRMQVTVTVFSTIAVAAYVPAGQVMVAVLPEVDVEGGCVGGVGPALPVTRLRSSLARFLIVAP